MLRSAGAAIATESERLVGVETGGVLTGFIDRTQEAVVVVAASGPGPRALHRANLFNRDRAHCQAWLDQCARASEGVLDFIGEWHKHREADPSPSGVDVRGYTGLAADPRCHLDRIVLLIAGTQPKRWPRRRDEFTWTNGWSVRADGVERREVEWLPDEAYLDLLRAVPR